MKRVEGWNFTFTPAPPEVLPAEVFEEERTLKLNGTTIALKRYAPAHTDSNISVHFTDADSGSCAGQVHKLTARYRGTLVIFIDHTRVHCSRLQRNIGMSRSCIGLVACGPARPQVVTHIEQRVLRCWFASFVRLTNMRARGAML